MEHMIRARIAAVLFSSASVGVAAPTVPPNVAVFNGEILDSTVDRFLHEYGARNDLTEFSVASQGGDVLASIRLAKWIKLKKLDVRVRVICYSGCANYLFVAGQRKTIEPGAFVAWHGDADQRDLRELVSSYAGLLKKREDGRRLSVSDRAFLRNNKLRFTGIQEAQRVQREFYREVAVNPAISRMGQEPVSFASEGWTFTIPAMAKLGINNVVAHENYGRAAYFHEMAPHAALVNGGPLLVFDVAADGSVIPLE